MLSTRSVEPGIGSTCPKSTLKIALIALSFPLFLGVAAFAPLAYLTLREVRRA